MGFLSRLLNRTRTDSGDRSSGHPQAGRAREYSLRAYHQFLDSLQRYPVDQNTYQVWNPILGSTGSVIATAVREGLIRPATDGETLDRMYTLSQLKLWMDKYGVKKKKRKALTVAALADALKPGDKQKLLGRQWVYSLTDTGLEVVAKYRESMRNERDFVENETFRLLLAGRTGEAADIVARFEAAQLFPRGMGIDWSRGYPQSYLLRVDYLMTRCRYDDTPYSEPVQKQIAASIALAELLGNHLAPNRMLAVTGGRFECKELETFLRDPCGGYAKSMEATDPSSMAEIYAHTKHSEAVCATDLERFAAGRVGKGIEILGVQNDNCRICEGGSDKRFRWSEMSRLPRLPRHWGCRCLYLPWGIGDDET